MLSYKEQYQHPHWQRKRLEIFRRDDWTCRCCGQTLKALHIHHLYYQSDLHLWQYDNDALVTVCNDCHKKLHRELAKLAGQIAFKILSGQVDATDFIKSIQKKPKPKKQFEQASIQDAINGVIR